MKRLLIILLVLLSVTSADAQRKKSRTKKKAKHTSVRRSRGRHHRATLYSEPEPEPEETLQYVTMGADKRMVFNDPPEGEPKPYVLINDIPYTGNLRDINVNDVIEASVVNRKSARAMYGPKASAGAVLIKARRLPAGLTGTPVTQLQPQATVQSVPRKSFIYNEEVTYGNVSDIAPEKILSIDTLMQPKFMGAKEVDTTISVTSKVYGRKLYQYKFGTLSKPYKRYIRSRRGNDKGVVYEVSDGTTLEGGNGDDLLKLFKLYSADIQSVEFTGPHCTRKNRVPAKLTIVLNSGTTQQ
ncbi:hypothetical protein [Mucilaginibacter sp.]|uniref:hypothetical protein n=1 Tax=Mucilaginibacter sp. TaxID=1882438 RepID=UPI000CA8B4F6|nr:hypothetical protein [Mucilaginibacter sp.]PLW91240.1 MAG: hypothetical protein C0154_02275 [Mucilaginibacter sp.]HEK20250.1 hypothetical protein [Bacteroidota bacterium]